MGWGFLKRAAGTALRVGAAHITGGFSEKVLDVVDVDAVEVDPDILAEIGNRTDVVASIADKAQARVGVGIKLGELYFGGKALVALYNKSMEDGNLSLEEAAALLDGLKEFVEDVDEVI